MLCGFICSVLCVLLLAAAASREQKYLGSVHKSNFQFRIKRYNKMNQKEKERNAIQTNGKILHGHWPTQIYVGEKLFLFRMQIEVP